MRLLKQYFICIYIISQVQHMFKVILLNFEEKGVKNILHHAKYLIPLPFPVVSIYPPATRLFKMETALVFPKPVAFTISELDRRLLFKSEYTRFSSSVRLFFSSLTGRTTLYPLLQNERKYFRSLLRSHFQKPLLLIYRYPLLFRLLFWPFSLLKYDMPDYMQTPMQCISELS